MKHDIPQWMSRTMNDAVVSLKNLRKDYGDLTVVSDFSLEMKRGELVCLLGPSGCGKTTTLRMLAGFITPTSGDIFINKENVTNVPAHRRDIGIVFQNYALFPHMTVAKNVEYGLTNIGMGKSEKEDRIQEMLGRVELGHLRDRYPRELSGGQQQRVALARALALQPKVLLLDEPFSNLDAQLRVRLRGDLHGLIQSLEMTTLFVTHDQDEALTLADRIVVMRQGTVEQMASPETIYDTPATRFVAEFVGACSFLEGEITEDGVFKTADDIKLANASGMGKATAILRPEVVRKAQDRPDIEPLMMVVEGSDYHGSLTRLQLRCGNAHILMDAQFERGKKPVVGESILVAVDPNSVRYLP
ncbi:putative spermidine/putrescine transport system ATP-binding protein [Bradyrhizobium sp. GM22.5]